MSYLTNLGKMIIQRKSRTLGARVPIDLSDCRKHETFIRRLQIIFRFSVPPKRQIRSECKVNTIVVLRLSHIRVPTTADSHVRSEERTVATSDEFL